MQYIVRLFIALTSVDLVYLTKSIQWQKIKKTNPKCLAE